MATRPSSGSVFVIILIFILLFNPGSQNGPVQNLALSRQVENERVALQALNSSSWGDLDTDKLNITGASFNWQLLPSVRDGFLALSKHAFKASHNESLFYPNITGFVTGKYIQRKLAQDLQNSLNFSTPLSGRTVRNVTSNEGKLQLFVREKADEDDNSIGEVTGHVTIEDASSYADGHYFSLHGVHLRDSGTIILTSNSDVFYGSFLLPHLLTLPTLFEHVKNSSVARLDRLVSTHEDRIANDVGNLWRDSRDASEPPLQARCELVFYLQQFALEPSLLNVKSGESARALDLLEADLRFPQGLYVSAPPPLRFLSTAFSPDCGFVIDTKGPPDYFSQDGRHLTGIKYEVRMRDASHAMLLYAAILILQLLLLLEQLKDASTPSKKSRVSFWTTAMLSLGSGCSAFAFLFLSSIVSRLLLPSLMVAFVAFMDGLFISMRFLLEIWTVQEPEQARSRLAQNTTQNTPATEPTLVIDTGATPMPIPVATVPQADTPTTFGSLYTRYCLLLLSIVFVSIWAASSWPRTLRTIYANGLVACYLSVWVPQIIRNVKRNNPKALSLKFVIGQSILRLLPVAYFWGYENNVLFVEPDLIMLAVFAAWLWVQNVVLFGQEIIGPRFFVRETWSWVPPAYEYHPILREDEEGATLPVGFAPVSPTAERSEVLGLNSGSETRRGKKKFDCAICMQRLEVAVVPAGESVAVESSAADVLSGGFIARRHYSVTPCRHIFHAACLESWMAYRLQCPICRETLPPS